MKMRWRHYLCGAVIVLTTPVMAHTTTTDITQQVIQHVTGQGEYSSPINGALEVLSPFGEERIGYVHQGIDLRMPIGTPIYAVADATVIKAAPDSKGVDAGGGHMIILEHDKGIQTWYMHLDAYAVNQGDKVTKGQIIGFSGCSGDSTTPLLHFEYRMDGIAVEPSFIFGQNTVTNESISEENKSLITLNEPFLVVQS